MLFTVIMTCMAASIPSAPTSPPPPDFSGVVKNPLNKVIAERWEEPGRAGYNWWENIVTIEHFDSLNDITSVLVGRLGSLRAVTGLGDQTGLSAICSLLDILEQMC